MIHARHSRWADVVFSRYLHRLLRRHFHALTLLGNPPAVRADTPLLLLPNHSTWWDGFFVYTLNREFLHRRLYLMMLESQLRRYSFFSRLGAYSVNPGSPRSVAETLGYTASLIERDPPPLVCMFPQGALLPWHLRPLGFQRGAEYLLARTRRTVTVLPLAMRCEFLGEQRPEVFFLFGSPVLCNAAAVPATAVLEQTHHHLLDDLERRILARERGHTVLAGGFRT